MGSRIIGATSIRRALHCSLNPATHALWTCPPNGIDLDYASSTYPQLIHLGRDPHRTLLGRCPRIMAGSGSVTVVDDIQEAESSEETGLFYKYIGSIDSGAALLGNGTGLQVAGTSGVLVCRQENGKRYLESPSGILPSLSCIQSRTTPSHHLPGRDRGGKSLGCHRGSPPGQVRDMDGASPHPFAMASQLLFPLPNQMNTVPALQG